MCMADLKRSELRRLKKGRILLIMILIGIFVLVDFQFCVEPSQTNPINNEKEILVIKKYAGIYSTYNNEVSWISTMHYLNIAMRDKANSGCYNETTPFIIIGLIFVLLPFGLALGLTLTHALKRSKINVFCVRYCPNCYCRNEINSLNCKKCGTELEAFVENSVK